MITIPQPFLLREALEMLFPVTSIVINPRLRSKHIECFSTYRFPKGNMENPLGDLYRSNNQKTADPKVSGFCVIGNYPLAQYALL